MLQKSESENATKSKSATKSESETYYDCILLYSISPYKTDKSLTKKDQKSP